MRQFYLISISILGLIAIIPNALKAQTNTLSSAIEKIETAFDAGDYEGIISESEYYLSQADGSNDTLALDVYYFVAESYLASGELERALAITEKERKARETFFPEQKVQYAYVLSALSNLYLKLGQTQKAGTMQEQAISILNMELGADHPDVLISKIGLADIYLLNNQHKQALGLLKKLSDNAAVKEAVDLQFLVAKNLSNALIESSQYTAAEQRLLATLELVEQNYGLESPEAIETMFYLGRLKRLRGDYGNADLLLTSVNEKIESSGTVQEIRPVSNYELARIEIEIGLYQDAIRLINKNLEDNNLDPVTKIHYKSILGIAYSSSKSYEKADQLFDELMLETASVFGTNSRENIRILNNKAKNLLLWDKTEKAIDYQKRCVSAFEKSFGKKDPDYGFYLYNLSQMYAAHDDPKNAKKHLEQSLRVREDILGKDHPMYAESTKKLAEINWLMDNIKKADEFYAITFDNLFKQIENYFPGLSEQEKVNFYNNKVKSAFEAYNSYIIEHASAKPELLGKMYDHQLATKALIMYASNKVRDRIMNSGEAELIEKYENWIANKELISQLYAMSNEERKAQTHSIDSLIGAANTLEKELSRLSADFAEQTGQSKVKWQDVQARLKADEAAVEMIRFRKFTPDKSGKFTDEIYYAALILKKDSKYPELVLIKNGAELETRYVKNYRNSIKFKLTDRFSYDQYWAPLKRNLEGVKTIYFSPDGVYNQISLNSLRNPDGGKYLLEEKNIRMLTNSKELLSYNEKAPVKEGYGKAHLFGFPNYDKGLVQGEADLNSLASKVASNVSLDRGLRGSLQRFVSANALLVLLPGTKEEVDLINQLYKENSEVETITLLGDEAVESAIKQVKSPHVLHIATHGFFLEDSKIDEDDNEKYVQNPLLKSGLIMAGANSYLTKGFTDSGNEDGILTAYEAMNLNLDHTELVVLSACETGLGDVQNGEGVYGLQRAFLVAGAQSIIMSLWSVDDKATQELMTLFYQEWLKNGDKQAAFQAAQIKLKEQYSSPFYWGAFVMLGQ